MKGIKKNFNNDYYNELVGGRKNTVDAHIVVCDAKKSKPINYIANSDIVHDTINSKMHLIIECSKVDRSKFGFKLMDKMFDEKPFFRFESSGTTHKNDLPNIPLEQQSITPPHFHRYGGDGRPYAFKTDAIKDILPTEAVAEECFIEFCNEANTRHNDDSYPTIETIPIGELKLDVSEIDPLKNIIFVP